MEYLNLYLQDSRVGSGRRNFVVMKRGRKNATLLYIPTLTKIEVPLSDLEKGKPVDIDEKTLRKNIRKQAEMRHALFCSWSKAAVRQLLGNRAVARIEAKYAAQYAAKEKEDLDRRAELRKYGVLPNQKEEL